MKKIIVLLFFSFIFSSCKDETTTITSQPEKHEPAQTAPADGQEYIAINKFVNEFASKRNGIIQQVKSLSPEEANALYTKYEAGNDEGLIKENEALKAFIGNHHDELLDKTSRIEIEKKITMFQQSGLEFRYIGEGNIVITEKPHFYSIIFYEYVSDDYKAYISLKAKNDKVVWTEDAAVAVPWDKIGESTIAWESMISKYPESALHTKMQENFEWFSWLFVIGIDNTPVKEYDGTQMYPEAKAAFQNYVKKHPESKITPILKMALDNKENGNAYIKTMEKAFQAL
jgi:hypothetical protein